MSLVEQKIVTAEELDYIAKWSLGVRMANTGPLEQRDINGIDSHFEIAKYVYPSLNNSAQPLEIHKNLISKEKYGIKTLAGFYKWNKKRLKSEMESKESKESTLKNIISFLSPKRDTRD